MFTVDGVEVKELDLLRNEESYVALGRYGRFKKVLYGKQTRNAFAVPFKLPPV